MLFSLALTVAIVVSLFPAQAAPASANPPAGRIVAGGMAAIQRTWPNVPGGLRDLETSITIAKEPGTNGLTYWAHQWGYSSGGGGYVGLQQRSGTEKAINFSIWEATSWTNADPRTNCRLFGHEGNGVQCDAPYAWREGVEYKITVARVGSTGWRAAITDTSTGITTPVATIVLPKDTGGISYLSEWVENFAQGNQALASCKDVAPNTAVYGMPRGNGGQIRPTGTTHHTYGTCAEVAQSACTADQVCTLTINKATPPPISPQPPTSPQQPASSSSVRLKNAAQGYCLDLLGGGSAAGLWNCAGGSSNQRVRQDAFKPIVITERPGQCLTVRTDSTVGAARCNSEAVQQWRRDASAGSYVNLATDKCLDATGGGAEGSPLRVYTCLNNSYQRWSSLSVAGSSPAFAGRLQNAAQNYCLDLFGGGPNAGLWNCAGGRSNQLVHQDQGSPLVMSERSNQCLTIRADSSVGSASCDNTTRQQWRYDANTMAYVNIGTNTCLEATRNGVEGAALRGAACTGKPAQRWDTTP